jgi:hypothetical protein
MYKHLPIRASKLPAVHTALAGVGVCGGLFCYTDPVGVQGPTRVKQRKGCCSLLSSAGAVSTLWCRSKCVLGRKPSAAHKLDKCGRCRLPAYISISNFGPVWLQYCSLLTSELDGCLCSLVKRTCERSSCANACAAGHEQGAVGSVVSLLGCPAMLSSGASTGPGRWGRCTRGGWLRLAACAALALHQLAALGTDGGCPCVVHTLSTLWLSCACKLLAKGGSAAAFGC